MSERRERCNYLGPRLQRLRRERGWTQEHLGWLTRVGPVTISRYERSLRLPTLPTLLKLAEVLEVSVADLVSPTAEPATPATAEASQQPGGSAPEVDRLVDVYLQLPPERRIIATQLMEALRAGA